MDSSLFKLIELEQAENSTVSSEVNTMLFDILVTICINKIDKSLILVLFSIDKILLGNKLVSSVDHDSFKKASFSGMVLAIEGLEDKYLSWNGTYLDQLKEVDGALCCQIRFSSISNNSTTNKALCKFLLDDLDNIKLHFNTILLSNANIVKHQFKFSFANSSLKKALEVVMDSDLNQNVDFFKCKLFQGSN